MPRFQAALAGLVLVCLASFAAAAERVPADSRWVIHADLQLMLRTKVGEWIGREMVKQPHAARLKMLEAISGLNLKRDLRHVTICGVGADDDSGLVYVRGTFDAERIGNLAQAAEGYAAVQAGSRTIHTWMDKGKPAAGCLAAADLLILGKSSTRVREALALLDASTAPGAVFQLPAGWEKSALVVCAAEDLAALADGKPESAMLRNVRSLVARVVEDGSLLAFEARAVAITEAAAQQMVDAGRGLAAIVQLQKPASLDPVLIETVRTGELSRDGVNVSLRLTVPFEDALRLVQQGKKAE